LSLATPDSISTSAPYCPANVKVLEPMAKFQRKSNTERQPNIAPGAENLNSSSTSSVKQAVLRSEENSDSASAVDVAMSRGLAVAERSTTLAPTSREGTRIQQLHGDDREAAGCGSVYFVNSPLSSTTFDKSVGQKTTNAVNILNDGARDVDCCSQSLTASTTVSLEGMERERLTTEAVGAWQRPRGRGRGRGCVIAGVSDTAVGRMSRVTGGGGGMGRGRACSVMQHCIEKDLSIERAAGSSERGKGAAVLTQLMVEHRRRKSVKTRRHQHHRMRSRVKRGKRFAICFMQ